MAAAAPAVAPTLSVVVPLYNEGDRVAPLVAHLRAMAGVAEVAEVAEVVIADASDPDHAAAVAAVVGAGDPLIRVLRCRRGRAAQMNAGARVCHGDILLFLHCDTRLPRDAAAAIRATLGAGHCWGRFHVRLDARGAAYRVIEGMINLRSRVRRLATGDQAMFVQRAVFEQSGGFADMPLMEDIELSVRLGRRGRPGRVRRPVITSARRWQSGGVVRTVLLMWKLRWLYWRGAAPERLAAMYGNAR